MRKPVPLSGLLLLMATSAWALASGTLDWHTHRICPLRQWRTRSWSRCWPGAPKIAGPTLCLDVLLPPVEELLLDALPRAPSETRCDDTSQGSTLDGVASEPGECGDHTVGVVMTKIRELEKGMVSLAESLRVVFAQTRKMVEDTAATTIQFLPQLVEKQICPLETIIEQHKQILSAAIKGIPTEINEAVGPIASRIRCLELASQGLAGPASHVAKEGSRLQLSASADCLPQHGEQVYIDGLKNDTYNRRFGSCVGYDPDSGRVLVSLWHDLPTKKFRPEHLTINAPCPRCGACLEGRTICCECHYGEHDGGIECLPRPSETWAHGDPLGQITQSTYLT